MLIRLRLWAGAIPSLLKPIKYHLTIISFHSEYMNGNMNKMSPFVCHRKSEKNDTLYQNVQRAAAYFHVPLRRINCGLKLYFSRVAFLRSTHTNPLDKCFFFIQIEGNIKAHFEKKKGCRGFKRVRRDFSTIILAYALYNCIL